VPTTYSSRTVSPPRDYWPAVPRRSAPPSVGTGPPPGGPHTASGLGHAKCIDLRTAGRSPPWSPRNRPGRTLFPRPRPKNLGSASLVAPHNKRAVLRARCLLPNPRVLGQSSRIGLGKAHHVDNAHRPGLTDQAVENPRQSKDARESIQEPVARSRLTWPGAPGTPRAAGEHPPLTTTYDPDCKSFPEQPTRAHPIENISFRGKRGGPLNRVSSPSAGGAV